MAGKPIDLTGQRFGRLVAVELTDRRDRHSGGAIWRCRCDCGNTCEVGAHELRNGNTRSCGCGNAENRKRSGENRNDAVLSDGSRADRYLSSRPRADNVVGVRGVGVRKSGRYYAEITFGGVTHTLGTFDTLDEAAWARREAEIKLYDPYLTAHGKPPTSEEEFLRSLRAAEEKEGNHAQGNQQPPV
ncbi:AP2 domain protein [Olsenella profusa]|uniref:AP2 domain protein n=1 Tax=Olsenella profusa F0195 TaxID=1125712 RepID=U2V3A7_9ACTN|nr:AP2 domain protein [Olsenella profusa]ERL09822.1 AP2 domain protein [Olsenella profusa F0195]